MVKRKGFVVLLVIFLSILIVGCSSSSGTEAETEDGKTVLSVWWNVDKVNDRSGYYDAVAKYEELNPDIKIDTQTLPYEQLKQKLTTSANNGNPPDIAQGLGEWTSDFHQMGVLANLTEDIEQWDEKQAIPDAVWDSLTIGGDIVAFPSYVGTRVRMYHEDLLTEAGITSPPETWDQLLEAGKKLKDAGVEHPYGISATSARAPQELAVYLWSNNLEIAVQQSDGNYKNTWLDNEGELKRATEVFQFYKDLQENEIISSTQSNWGYEELDQSFAQANVAMVQNGPWMLGYEEEHPEGMADVKVNGVPVYKETPATFLEVAPFFIFNDSNKKEEAMKFLQWMGTKEGQELYAKGNRTVRSDMELEGEWNIEFSKVTEYGKSWPAVPMGGITEVMKDSIQKVLLGDTTPEETAKWLSEQINQSLEENGMLSGS